MKWWYSSLLAACLALSFQASAQYDPDDEVSKATISGLRSPNDSVHSHILLNIVPTIGTGFHAFELEGTYGKKAEPRGLAYWAYTASKMIPIPMIM